MYRNPDKYFNINILYMQHQNSKKAEIVFKTLAKVIRREREKQNKSLRILADEYDIQKSLLSRLENGVNEPKLISIWTISEALNMPVSSLLRLVEEELPRGFTFVEKCLILTKRSPFYPHPLKSLLIHSLEKFFINFCS